MLSSLVEDSTPNHCKMLSSTKMEKYMKHELSQHESTNNKQEVDEDGRRFPCLFADSCLNIEYNKLRNLLRACNHMDANQGSFCLECEKNFMREVYKEMSAASASLASCSRRLLRPRVSCGFERLLWKPKHIVTKHHHHMMEEAQNLITYAASNSLAFRNLLHEYQEIQRNHKNEDKIYIKVQAKRVELLKSPWLLELCALYINSCGAGSLSAISGFSCNFSYCEDNGPSITCNLLESLKIEFNLSCPICLETAFEPIAFGCGHIFCNSCACNCASITTIDGLKAANQDTKCPICRKGGVYANSIYLRQSALMLQKRCKTYWMERLRAERSARVKQAKQHWNQQSQIFVGF